MFLYAHDNCKWADSLNSSVNQGKEGDFGKLVQAVICTTSFSVSSLGKSRSLSPTESLSHSGKKCENSTSDNFLSKAKYDIL